MRVNAPGEQKIPYFPFGSIRFGQLGFASNYQVVQETAHEGICRGAGMTMPPSRPSEQASVPLVLSGLSGQARHPDRGGLAARVLLANFGAWISPLFDVIGGKAEGPRASPSSCPPAGRRCKTSTRTWRRTPRTRSTPMVPAWPERASPDICHHPRRLRAPFLWVPSTIPVWRSRAALGIMENFITMPCPVPEAPGGPWQRAGR